jgi:hypothetical protein
VGIVAAAAPSSSVVASAVVFANTSAFLESV